MMGDLSRDFSRHEFACKCCKQVIVDLRLVEALQALRDLAGVKIIIISGYRCPKHNAEVGGEKNSYHLAGMAADIVIEGLSIKQMYWLANQIPEFRRGGIGVYPEQGFIHVDVRSSPACWAKLGGKYVSVEEGLERSSCARLVGSSAKKDP